jgi:hypothetical protein
VKSCKGTVANEGGRIVATEFPSLSVRDWSHFGGFHGNQPLLLRVSTLEHTQLSHLSVSCSHYYEYRTGGGGGGEPVHNRI